MSKQMGLFDFRHSFSYVFKKNKDEWNACNISRNRRIVWFVAN